ncbi:hypothetical protein EDEG_03566 [Edhazardia aedis USNM 41457]|uniref:Uncharacterized protein n=1 Tax=Edhazardia aedis (strain USNM 41457) TaxID=1003232 RepID=J9DKP9_EDHAE|nr:hypothetical protein EDEG_03566 [Edhazardia aedis USNM 41457]|eukprot:EJW01967.1 hypothetical protein EDEG_03566 [Edhazardia aedis USNM 41457]
MTYKIYVILILALISFCYYTSLFFSENLEIDFLSNKLKPIYEINQKLFLLSMLYSVWNYFRGSSDSGEKQDSNNKIQSSHRESERNIINVNKANFLVFFYQNQTQKNKLSDFEEFIMHILMKHFDELGIRSNNILQDFEELVNQISIYGGQGIYKEVRDILVQFYNAYTRHSSNPPKIKKTDVKESPATPLTHIESADNPVCNANQDPTDLRLCHKIEGKN